MERMRNALLQRLALARSLLTLSPGTHVQSACSCRKLYFGRLLCRPTTLRKISNGVCVKGTSYGDCAQPRHGKAANSIGCCSPAQKSRRGTSKKMPTHKSVRVTTLGRGCQTDLTRNALCFQQRGCASRGAVTNPSSSQRHNINYTWCLCVIRGCSASKDAHARTPISPSPMVPRRARASRQDPPPSARCPLNGLTSDIDEDRAVRTDV
mmetsp:Transcript_35525/g.99323  ORF Transcript_35525/g.99323 Transcript_35525/m.99323 type:complete len:209 (-) Transcript_35525:488-1114(-)